jgi:hypothetical protein
MPVSLKRENSSDSDGFKTAISSRSLTSAKNSSNNLGKITSLNSLSKAATRTRSNSNGGEIRTGGANSVKITPAPKKDDVVSVGKLAFSKAHVIGRGSFGTMVYAGAHAEFGRAAIKAISKEGTYTHNCTCPICLFLTRIVTSFSGWAGSHHTSKDGLLDDSLNDSFGAQEDATPAEVMAIADRKILLMISQKGIYLQYIYETIFA